MQSDEFVRNPRLLVILLQGPQDASIASYEETPACFDLSKTVTQLKFRSVKIAYPLLLAFLFAAFPNLSLCGEAAKYQAPKSIPEIEIKAVRVPKGDCCLAELAFRITAKGVGLVSLPRDEFSIEIQTPKGDEVFSEAIGFPTNTPPILKVDPKSPIFLLATVRCKPELHFPVLPTGKYRARVHVSGSKSRNFDYRYLGLLASKLYDFETK